MLTNLNSSRITGKKNQVHEILTNLNSNRITGKEKMMDALIVLSQWTSHHIHMGSLRPFIRSSSVPDELEGEER